MGKVDPSLAYLICYKPFKHRQSLQDPPARRWEAPPGSPRRRLPPAGSAASAAARCHHPENSHPAGLLSRRISHSEMLQGEPQGGKWQRERMSNGVGTLGLAPAKQAAAGQLLTSKGALLPAAVQHDSVHPSIQQLEGGLGACSATLSDEEERPEVERAMQRNASSTCMSRQMRLRTSCQAGPHLGRLPAVGGETPKAS